MKLFSGGLVASLIAVALLIAPHVSHAQNSRGCAWPLEASTEGVGNFTAPDDFARYWWMPIGPQDRAITIKGTYPSARYFSYVVYDGNSPVDVAGHVYDAQIAPDPGSTNPFVPTEKTRHSTKAIRGGTYTLEISRSGKTSGNTIALTSASGWILLRLYVPNAAAESGRTLMGNVPLPSITVKRGETSEKLPTCSPVNKLADLSAFVQTVFPQDLTGNEGKSSSDRLWFAPPTVPPIVLFPNPDNAYMGMIPGDYQPGRVIVIHGKAPGFPDTFDGSPIWTPARGFHAIDMRYWSVCNNDLVLPVPAVQCLADLTTKRQGGYYTIVISDDLLRPAWLPPEINWLPWGDEQYPKLVFFRNMLPAPTFPFSVQGARTAGCTFDFNLSKLPNPADLTAAGQCAAQVMGDYYPVAIWCDQSTFEHGGWQACARKE